MTEIRNMSFEDAMKELEATVGKLEHGEATLEESIAVLTTSTTVHWLRPSFPAPDCRETTSNPLRPAAARSNRYSAPLVAVTM